MGISTNERDMVLKALEFNKRVAKMVAEEEHQRQQKIKDSVRVKNLKPIWNQTIQED